MSVNVCECLKNVRNYANKKENTMSTSNRRYSLPRIVNAMRRIRSFDSITSKDNLQFCGDLDCVRLCNDAMQDINDDSNLGDICNEHAVSAMTADERQAEDAFYASQHYRFKS